MNKILLFGFACCMLVGFSSCKSKKSAYKSVYQAAKEREMTASTTTSSASTAQAPASSYASTPLRREKITAVDASDASGLKAYNVVVASLSAKPNAELLKTRLEKDGMNVILAQNEQGMYRVIVASYDDKESAYDKREQIVSKYTGYSTPEELRKNYGIPFNDLWILHKY